MASNRTTLFRFDEAIAEEFFAVRGRRPCLVGIDEAGRGPWAGPVVASALVLPEGFDDPRLNDSKQVRPQTRERLHEDLLRAGASWSVGIGTVGLIDSVNILRATHAAMKSALDGLLQKNPGLKPDLVLIDGRPVPDMGFPQRSIVDGDCQSACIAAASVVAKVTRDRMMLELDREYPQYGFARHKGYGTRLHQETLREHGPSPAHRQSFAPVREAVSAHGR
jgi:ribonuclease HII